MASLLCLQTIPGLLFLAALLLTACTQKKPAELPPAHWGKIIINPTVEDNKKNWELWKSKNVRHFRYKTKITCENCTLETYNKAFINPDYRIARGISWTIVEVDNNQVISVKNIDGTDNHEFAERLKIYQVDVIAKAFEWIEGYSQYEFNTRIAIYDSTYGFPRYAEILPSKLGPTDIGHRIEIVEFEVLPELTIETKQSNKQ
jgi:predicted small lipoprotein YifL